MTFIFHHSSGTWLLVKVNSDPDPWYSKCGKGPVASPWWSPKISLNLSSFICKVWCTPHCNIRRIILMHMRYMTDRTCPTYPGPPSFQVCQQESRLTKSREIDMWLLMLTIYSQNLRDGKKITRLLAQPGLHRMPENGLSFPKISFK